MLQANNLNEDEFVRIEEFYDKTLYRVGAEYLTHGTVSTEDYEQLTPVQKNTIAWLRRTVKKLEEGLGTEVDE